MYPGIAVFVSIDWTSWATRADKYYSLVTVVASVVGLFLTSFVILASLYNLRLASRLLSESKALRLAETEPEVAVYLGINKHSSQRLDMVIHNIGRGAAHDIRLGELDPAPETLNISTFRPRYARYIEFMAPGQEIHCIFDFGLIMMRRHQDVSFSIDASYKSAAGRSVQKEYRLNPRVFEGQLALSDPTVQMAESLGRLANFFSSSGVFGGGPQFRVELVRPYWRHRTGKHKVISIREIILKHIKQDKTRN
jgi:hypothetical protein